MDGSQVLVIGRDVRSKADRFADQALALGGQASQMTQHAQKVKGIGGARRQLEKPQAMSFGLLGPSGLMARERRIEDLLQRPVHLASTVPEARSASLSQGRKARLGA